MWVVIVCVVLAGCGRDHFDPLGDAHGDGDGAGSDATPDADSSLVVDFKFEGSLTDSASGITATCLGGNCPTFVTWSHPAYNDKCKSSLMSVWRKVVITLDEHKLDDATDISGELNTKISKWKKKVTKRKTTHANWTALCGGDDDARQIFSMA